MSFTKNIRAHSTAPPDAPPDMQVPTGVGSMSLGIRQSANRRGTFEQRHWNSALVYGFAYRSNTQRRARHGA
jgi:hypothetical protein